ncbi:MAG: hypothetical protein V4525_00935 [Pseudomonadota bacterium]
MPKVTITTPRWVVLVYFLGMLLGFFYEPFGLITLGWLCWYQRVRINSTVQKLVDGILSWVPADRALWAWLPLLAIGVMVATKGGFSPLDDLSRHIGAYQHGFDYRNHFLYSEIVQSVTISPWYGFEWVVGHIHQTILTGLASAFKNWIPLNQQVAALTITHFLVEILAFGMFVWVFMPIFRHAFQHHPMPHAMTGIALGLLIGLGLGLRLQQGRPEVFLMLAMFSVWRLPPRIWIILMMVLQPLYWLAWIYSVGAILITSWRWLQKAIAVVLILSAYALFWHYYCGLEAVGHFFYITSQALKIRIVHAGENQPILASMMSVWGALWVFLIVMALYQWGQGKLRARERQVLIVMSVFWLLLNQARYNLYSLPYLAYLWAHQSPDNPLLKKLYSDYRIRAGILGILVATSIFCAKQLPIEGFSNRLPAFKTLTNKARVLTYFNASTFILPTLYPGLKVAPPMEIGFTDMPLQKFLKDSFEYRGLARAFNCEILKKNFSQFTHIVDARDDALLPSISPACLQFKETAGGWNLWEINYTK